MAKELFSIITVTLNNLKGLEQTARSILTQTHTDFEWIVIDGGSTDGTPALLEQTPARWISQPDAGIYDAMNKGIARATGEYLIFLNAGDCLVADTTLEHIARTLKDHPALIYGDAFEDGNYKPARPAAAYAAGMFTHHQSMLYNRAAIGSMRYDTTYKIAADYDFTARLLQNCQTLAQAAQYLPLPICRFETGGISQTSPLKGRREQYKVRKNLRLCPPWKNAAIFILQTLIWQIRQGAPALYWRLKSSRNNGHGTAQNQAPPPRPENRA